MFASLEQRRKMLRISMQTLADRCGLSLATVQRILADNSQAASFQNVAAVATALGMRLSFEPTLDEEQMRERQAERKARELVAMVQATSALEGQAVDPAQIEAMVKQTMHELLAGSPRRLWAA